MYGTLFAHQTQPIPTLTAAQGEVPPRVAATFEKMLAKQPTDRFSFMGDVVTHLEKPEPKGIVSSLLAWIGPQ